jgi:hypothetical protein
MIAREALIESCIDYSCNAGAGQRHYRSGFAHAISLLREIATGTPRFTGDFLIFRIIQSIPSPKAEPGIAIC